jgi:hypothetical protein
MSSNGFINHISEPFHGIFTKTFIHFFKLDALFILGLYIINLLGGFLILYSQNIAIAIFSVLVIVFLILVNYTYFKSLQYKKIDKKIKHYEILGKHIVIAITLGVVIFVLIGIMLKIIEFAFNLNHVKTIQRIIAIIMIIYTYLLFLNSHNHDHHHSFKAIFLSAKTLKFNKILKILYIDFIYIAIIYLVHNSVMFLFQFLFLKLNAPISLLNPIYTFIETSLFIILIIAILSMNKVIIYQSRIKNTKNVKKNKKKRKK